MRAGIGTAHVVEPCPQAAPLAPVASEYDQDRIVMVMAFRDGDGVASSVTNMMTMIMLGWH